MERGLNENTNDLIRQYFPKRTILLEVSPEQVAFAINQMNHRPANAWTGKPRMRYSLDNPASGLIKQ